MAITVQQTRPVVHLPLVLGVLRCLEVAALVDDLIPPHPAHVLSTGRGVEALVLAILDGDHALYKVGQRLEARGLVALLQPGLARAALHDYRLGHILDALFAANLNKVFSAIALKALEVYAIPTPWLHQDTTTIALYGAYADESQTTRAPRPAYGHSKDGRDDLKQVLLSLGMRGDGGLPLRVGLRVATAATVWKPRSRLRSAWPWAWKAGGGSWRIVRPIVVGPWGCVLNAVWA
jgi:transposase